MFFRWKKSHSWTQDAETRSKTPSELQGGQWTKCFLVRVLLLWDCLFWVGIPLYSQIAAPIYAILTEIFMKSTSTWYSTGSSWPDLPNGRKISAWLHRFPGKLAVHPGVGVAQLTISKFLRNPRGSCAAPQPPAFEQLEYCWPWNIVLRPIDPILFGQLSLSAVERAHNNGCWPSANSNR